jgi:wyosine [tRNA(Phe)-imidazoG37] synthetase (radical SAM superfamily)
MYTYGPVPSRRLGRSLGVSPIPPKTCSYSCVYCQLGRTKNLQIERKSFSPKEEIFSEIAEIALDSNPDYITFVGDGEPTLCKDLGWLINKTKSELRVPVAVITNGSLFFLEDVRKDLLEADIILPTLDAGTDRVFRRINRPHRSIKFYDMLCGMRDFRLEFTGKIWLEVMLVNGLNDSGEELLNIKNAVDLIQPDRIYVVTPIRPPAEPWVEPPSPKKILEAQQLLGGAVPLTDSESGDFGLREFADARQAIMEIGARHPLRLEQAMEIEKSFSSKDIVKKMIEEGKLIKAKYNNKNYLLPSHFIRGRGTNGSVTGEEQK